MTIMDELEVDAAHREFMLAALRVASARCKLMDHEITAVGTALKTTLIEPEEAVRWLREMGLMFLIEPLPSAIDRAKLKEITDA